MPSAPTKETTMTAAEASAAFDPDALGAYLFSNYRRAPVAFERGSGCRLWSTAGKEYLDFVAGIAVCSLGHADPRLAAAIADQAARLLHVSNLYWIPEQAEAARRLVQASGGAFQRAFFCNSGAEANEALIKIARKRGSASGRYEIVVADNSFHGRTLGALAATGNPAYHRGFAPLPEGFRFVPFNDLGALEAAIGERTCAVLLEPIQGEGGVYPATTEYLQGAERLCRKHDLLFLLDEVQTGIGRTGLMFAFEHYGVTPHAIALAKGLGGGVAVGAVLAQEEAANLQPGEHGTTFGGNPLAMAAVIAVQKALTEDGVLQNATAMGRVLQQRLEALVQSSRGAAISVRGKGLLLAVALDPALPAPKVVERCFERGLLVNAVRPDTIRMAPPLVVTEGEIDRAVGILGEALAAE